MIRIIARIAACVCLISGSALYAQEESWPANRKPTFGLRFDWFGIGAFQVGAATSATAKPIAEYTYSASSTASNRTLTPFFEYRLSRRVSIGGEFQFRRVQYRLVTEMLSGRIDPNVSVDDRITTTIVETTRANYWEFPLVLRLYGLRTHGLLRKGYLTAGMAFRHVSKIRTGTEYAYADGVTDYNEVPIAPRERNQLGFVIGAGLRWLDGQTGVKVGPEVRYVRWQGSTFSGPGYRSVKDQFEAGVGLSF